MSAAKKPALLPALVAIREKDAPERDLHGRTYLVPRADAARYIRAGTADFVPLPPWEEMQRAALEWWESNKATILRKD